MGDGLVPLHRIARSRNRSLRQQAESQTTVRKLNKTAPLIVLCALTVVGCSEVSITDSEMCASAQELTASITAPASGLSGWDAQLEAIVASDDLDASIEALGDLAERGEDSEVTAAADKMHFAFSEFAVDVRTAKFLEDYSLAEDATTGVFSATAEFGDACLAID